MLPPPPPMPPHTNLPPSLPGCPILSFNFAGPQPPHSYPAQSTNTIATICCANNMFQLWWNPSFPQPVTLSLCCQQPGTTPYLLVSNSLKGDLFGVPSARCVGTLTNLGFIIGYNVFQAVAVDMHPQKIHKDPIEML